MKKILAIVLVLLLLSSGTSYATTVSGQSAVYKVTVTKVEVQTEGMWVTVATPNQQMDIASGDVNAVIGTIISSSTIKAGTYTGFAVTVDATFEVKGFSDLLGARYYTTSSGTGSVSPSSTWDWDNLPVDYAERSLTVPGYTAVTMEATGKTIVIKPGSGISFKFAFNTTGTITYNGADVVLSGPPTINFTATIDGTAYGPYTMTVQ
jgi:hypothetical protein